VETGAAVDGIPVCGYAAGDREAAGDVIEEAIDWLVAGGVDLAAALPYGTFWVSPLAADPADSPDVAGAGRPGVADDAVTAC